MRSPIAFPGKMLFQTIKIAGAAILAILAATAAGADFAVSAGIIAILTIQPTKKETVKTAVGRLAAFASALVISYGCFWLLGCTLRAFLLYLGLYILLCQICRWYSAMAMNSVLVSHFVTVGVMDANSVCNEMIIFGIGVCMGILANLHLREDVDYMRELKEGTDSRIRNILSRMSERILDSDITDYNGQCFIELEHHLREAKNVAEQNLNNRIRSGDTYDKDYIYMRDRQCQVLYEMYKTVRGLGTTPVTAAKISAFLRELSEEYHEDNSGSELLIKFEALNQDMKKEPLPAERKEFEDRAKLFELLRQIEEFINIKIDFSQKYAERETKCRI